MKLLFLNTSRFEYNPVLKHTLSVYEYFELLTNTVRWFVVVEDQYGHSKLMPDEKERPMIFNCI